MGSYENNGKPRVDLVQLFLQLDPAHAWQAHVENQAGELIVIVTSEKVLSRGEGSWRKAGRLYYASQRFAQGFIIVHDCDDGAVGQSLIHFRSPNLRRVRSAREYETIDRAGRKLSCFVLKNLLL